MSVLQSYQTLFFVAVKIPNAFALAIGSILQERDNGPILGPHERHNPNRRLGVIYSLYQ